MCCTICIVNWSKQQCLATHTIWWKWNYDFSKNDCYVLIRRQLCSAPIAGSSLVESHFTQKSQPNHKKLSVFRANFHKCWAFNAHISGRLSITADSVYKGRREWKFQYTTVVRFKYQNPCKSAVQTVRPLVCSSNTETQGLQFKYRDPRSAAHEM